MGDGFQPLQGLEGIRAAFIPRVAEVDVDADRETVLERLAPYHCEILEREGFDATHMAVAEQVHGKGVVVARCAGFHSGVDALITNVRGLALGIYVADCAAVYFVDQKGRGIGLAHSGRAGTELNITEKTIGHMQEEFGVNPSDLIVEISPCIRPPHYQVDFAAMIMAQAQACGVGEVRDAGICTGREVRQYYSYRIESGRTGRMLAVISLNP